MMAKLFLTFLVLAAHSLWAMPAQILLMRHGEKPVVGNELSAQGWRRAQALPTLFARPELRRFGLPVGLYAMAPSHPGGSIRAIETLSFTSKVLNEPTNAQFTKDLVPQLVAQIKSNSAFNGKFIVICWEHTVLLEIAREFGLPNPPDWPDTQFDRMWNLNFSPQGQLIGFQNLPERLLPTDSPK